MEDKLKFVVRGKKEGNKFILDEITNYHIKESSNKYALLRYLKF